jgi:hypothetical protein
VVTTFSTYQISKISDSAHEAAGRIKRRPQLRKFEPMIDGILAISLSYDTYDRVVTNVLSVILLPLEPRRELRRYHWSKMPITRYVVDCTRWKDESIDWEIWEIGSGRDDWPMLITADEDWTWMASFRSPPCHLPFIIVIHQLCRIQLEGCHLCHLADRKDTYTIPGVGMPTAEE